MEGAGGEKAAGYTQMAEKSEIRLPQQGKESCKTDGGLHEGGQTKVKKINREMKNSGTAHTRQCLRLKEK